MRIAEIPVATLVQRLVDGGLGIDFGAARVARPERVCEPAPVIQTVYGGYIAEDPLRNVRRHRGPAAQSAASAAMSARNANSFCDGVARTGTLPARHAAAAARVGHELRARHAPVLLLAAARRRRRARRAGDRHAGHAGFRQEHVDGGPHAARVPPAVRRVRSRAPGGRAPAAHAATACAEERVDRCHPAASSRRRSSARAFQRRARERSLTWRPAVARRRAARSRRTRRSSCSRASTQPSASN